MNKTIVVFAVAVAVALGTAGFGGKDCRKPSSSLGAPDYSVLRHSNKFRQSKLRCAPCVPLVQLKQTTPCAKVKATKAQCCPSGAK